jgi:NTP pyrophosphatase (non-canonical NTP hydrolase)
MRLKGLKMCKDDYTARPLRGEYHGEAAVGYAQDPNAGQYADKVRFATEVPKIFTNRRESAEHAEKQAHVEREAEREAMQHVNLSVQTDLAICAVMPGLEGGLSVLAAQINRWMQHQGFWTSRNVGEKLALMHSEISEAMEADRKGLMSDHIGGFTGVEEEMADVVIRVLDFCHENNLRLASAIQAKMVYNLSRPYMHGKKY